MISPGHARTSAPCPRLRPSGQESWKILFIPGRQGPTGLECLFPLKKVAMLTRRWPHSNLDGLGVIPYLQSWLQRCQCAECVPALRTGIGPTHFLSGRAQGDLPDRSFLFPAWKRTGEKRGDCCRRWHLRGTWEQVIEQRALTTVRTGRWLFLMLCQCELAEVLKVVGISLFALQIISTVPWGKLH